MTPTVVLVPRNRTIVQPCVAYNDQGQVTYGQRPQQSHSGGRRALADGIGATIADYSLPPTVEYTPSMLRSNTPQPSGLLAIQNEAPVAEPPVEAPAAEPPAEAPVDEPPAEAAAEEEGAASAVESSPPTDSDTYGSWTTIDAVLATETAHTLGSFDEME